MGSHFTEGNCLPANAEMADKITVTSIKNKKRAFVILICSKQQAGNSGKETLYCGLGLL
jgi:hypothetical protein